MTAAARQFNGPYRGEHLNYVAFPMGGIGAGMICLEGTGTFSHVSLRHKPEIMSDSRFFSAVCVKGRRGGARVLEGPVPRWRAFGRPGTGNGASGTHYGLPRFRSASFRARFPFGTATLSDRSLPLRVEVTGWSPFTPGDADSSSLPVAGVEYRFRNTSASRIEAVYSFHAMHFLTVLPTDGSARTDSVDRSERGFVLRQGELPGKPAAAGAFCAEVDSPDVKVDCALFRSGWWDPLTMVWRRIAGGEAVDRSPVTEGEPSPGGSLYLPFRLAPGRELTVRLLLSWYVPASELRVGGIEPAAGEPKPCHAPWYAGAFSGIEAVASVWRRRYEELRGRTAAFTDAFYDTDLPPEVVEAVAANLTILKSPTVLRQRDGRVWAWEGCCDGSGCCHGTCTHVWNYAQALPHLFPDLERTLRETEFGPSQDERGHQTFRASLPIGPTPHTFHAAADGQLGGIMKVCREWRISGDTAWMRGLWPSVRASLDYCIATWDPTGRGMVVEPHHNTYDIEFWGPDGLCTSFYLGALKAASLMGRAAGADVSRYEELLARGWQAMETGLWNGEYFFQKVEWKGLRAGDPTVAAAAGGHWNVSYSSEAAELLRREGPKYQYGTGLLADGVLGAWMAAVCGVGDILDPLKIDSHLRAVHRHNVRTDLWDHANPQRPSFAFGRDGGLVLCTWPRGGRTTLPFVYCDEVWTGFEYQVASHLMLMGRVREGLEIVRLARRRYDGTDRNPFNEYECGHWYARAMSSYALLQGLTGFRYDAVEKTVYVSPLPKGRVRGFFSAATGFGTVAVDRKSSRVAISVRGGSLDVEKVVLGDTELVRGKPKGGANTWAAPCRG